MNTVISLALAATVISTTAALGSPTPISPFAAAELVSPSAAVAYPSTSQNRTAEVRTAPPAARRTTTNPGMKSAAVRTFSIPEGTPIRVRLRQKLQSGVARTGDRIAFEIVSPVWTPDHQTLLIPAHTPAWGTVRYASGCGMLGRSGKLRFTCDYVALPNGGRVPLQAPEPFDRQGDDQRIASIASTLMLNHMGFLRKGGNITVAAGEEMDVSVKQTTRMRTAGCAVDAATNPPEGKRLFLLRDGTVKIAAVCDCTDGVYHVDGGSAPQTFNVRDVQGTYTLAADGQTPAGYLFLHFNNEVDEGTLLGMSDGHYSVSTLQGTRTLRVGDVRALYPLASLPTVSHATIDPRIILASAR